MANLKTLFRKVPRLLDYAGRAYLVWQLGGATVIGALAAWGLFAADVMPTPIKVVLAFGIGILGFASVGAVAPFVAAQLPARPSRRPVAIGRSVATLDGAKRRVAVQEAISTLEYQRDAIQSNQIFDPGYSGEWYSNRALVAESPRHALALRGMERALLAVSQVDGGTNRHTKANTGQAVRAINSALNALEESLKEDD